MINFEAIKNEKALRTIIKKNLNKEDAYNSGMKYDVSDIIMQYLHLQQVVQINLTIV